MALVGGRQGHRMLLGGWGQGERRSELNSPVISITFGDLGVASRKNNEKSSAGLLSLITLQEEVQSGASPVGVQLAVLLRITDAPSL